MGMRLFRESAGLVRLSPLSLRASLSFLRYRSMDAGLVFLSFSAMSGVILKVGHTEIYGICCRIKGARIFPHVYQKKAQTRLRESVTSSV
jgi:hypothetical protein